MTEDKEKQRFHEGDVLTIRNGVYEVSTVDASVDGEVIQYRLDAREGPPATLLPDATGDDDKYVLKEFRGVSGEDITVVE